MNDNRFHKPPELAIRFLEWFCPPQLYESIEGDLLEEFAIDMETSGVAIARRKFIVNVFRFFTPEIILRNRFSFHFTDTIMFRNYIIIAYRNILKNKVFSGINVFGLAIGLAAC